MLEDPEMLERLEASDMTSENPVQIDCITLTAKNEISYRECQNCKAYQAPTFLYCSLAPQIVGGRRMR